MDATLNPSTQSGASGTGASSAVSSNGSISNMFTTLLVAQIKNQNPLEPTDPSQFVNQLTQLSQMEALQKLSDQGSSNAAALGSLQALALGGQVGSQVTVKSDSVTLATEPVQIGFTLGSNSTRTTLVLTGSDGRQKSVELGSHNAGDVAYSIDPAALGLSPGHYTMAVQTSSQEAPSLEVTGTLSSVQLSSTGAALLNVAGVGQLGSGALTRFNGKPNATTTASATH